MKLAKCVGAGRYAYHHLDTTNYETVVPWPCSEEIIIALHDTLLSPGEHRLRVPTLSAGRELIEPLVMSMHSVYEHAILSLDAAGHEFGAIDMYSELLHSGYLFNHADLQEFILAFSNVDFLWIEETQFLTKTSWYKDFLNLLKKLHCTRHMSIVIVTC